MTLAPLPVPADPAELAAAAHRLAAPAPAAPPPARPAPVGEAALTRSALAALLASPGDPTAAGTLGAPVRSALAGPLRRLLAPDEQGWHLAPGAVLGAAAAWRADAAPSGTVAAPVVAALLAPAGDEGVRDGWRLPERG